MDSLESIGKAKTSVKAANQGNSGALRNGNFRSSLTGRTGGAGPRDRIDESQPFWISFKRFWARFKVQAASVSLACLGWCGFPLFIIPPSRIEKGKHTFSKGNWMMVERAMNVGKSKIASLQSPKMSCSSSFCLSRIPREAPLPSRQIPSAV